MLNNLGILDGNKIIQKVVCFWPNCIQHFFLYGLQKRHQLPSLTFKKSALLQLTNIYFNEEISGRHRKKKDRHEWLTAYYRQNTDSAFEPFCEEDFWVTDRSICCFTHFVWGITKLLLTDRLIQKPLSIYSEKASHQSLRWVSNSQEI